MVQHFRLVNYHFFYPAISIVLQFLHAEHGELATPLSRSLSHHGGLRETGALGDAGVSVPGGAWESWYPLIAGWFTIGKIPASTMEDLGVPMGTTILGNLHTYIETNYINTYLISCP